MKRKSRRQRIQKKGKRQKPSLPPQRDPGDSFSGNTAGAGPDPAPDPAKAQAVVPMPPGVRTPGRVPAEKRPKDSTRRGPGRPRSLRRDEWVPPPLPPPGPPRSKEELLGLLNAMTGPGPLLLRREVQRRNPALLKEFITVFGSWKAIRGALIERRPKPPKLPKTPRPLKFPKPPRQAPPREAAVLLAEIEALAENGFLLRRAALRAKNPALLKEALRRFGTWAAIPQASSLPLMPARILDRTFSREAVLAKMTELQRTHPLLLRRDAEAQPGGRALGRWAVRYFGSWDKALAAAGLPLPPPAWEKHLPKKELLYPDQASVLEAIRGRAAAGLPLLQKSLTAKKAEGGNLNLGRRAFQLFGGWREAVAAAGLLKEDEPVVSRRFWNAEDVLRELRRRHAEGLPVSGLALHKGPAGDPTLIEAARRFFGSLHAALEAARLPVEGTRVPHFTRAAALKELARRHRAGLPVAARAVLSENAIGRRLHDDLKSWFPTWKAVLKAAGIEENAVRPPHPLHRFDHQGDVVTALRARLYAGLPVDLASLNRPKSEGGDTSLVLHARRYFRSWADALSEARKPQADSVGPAG